MTLADASPHTEEQDTIRLLRDSAADYCERALPRGRVRAFRGAGSTFDRARWREMAELGWASILVPEVRGGLGLGAQAMGAVCEALGRAVAPEPMIESGVAAAVLLGWLPSPLSDRLLEQVMAGETVLVAALPADASAPLTVRAERGGSGYTLNGDSAFMSLAPEADGFLVPAALGGGLALFHVAADSDGLDIRMRDLADGGRDGALVLQNVRCEPDALLGQGGEAQEALDRAGALSCLASSAALVGITAALLDMTLEYLRTRRQFGRPIGSFQALQHRAVDLFIRKRVGEAVVHEALEAFDAAETAEERARAASRAKYRSSEAALLVARQAIQLHGAIGFTDESDVGLYLNRALVLAARHGNAQWHARRLGRLHRSHASEESAGAGAAGARTEPPGGDWNALSNAEFRAIVRNWFEANYPEALRNPPKRMRWHEIKDWYFKLSEHGWVAPAWPREHGGMGLSPEKLLIFIEEQERWGVARAPDQGILMVGPLLIQHGTPEQQARFLPKIIAGEHIWCQGYSEPEAGSDLASLRTTATREGDEFVINGQKTWTTLAQDATHMFCLARTAKEGKPQAGISFLLIDLNVPGITIRPIRNIAGHEEFCEVFLDNVRVPAENLVGGLNQGWTIAKALLGFERIFIGSPKHSQYALQRLEEIAAASDLGEDVGFRDQLTRLKIDVLDLETIYKYFADIVRRGERLGTDISLLKIWATETFARLSELMVEAAGEQGGVTGTLSFGNARVDVLSQFYGARPTPIYGGTNEIQRNILAKEVLGLPTA